MVQLLQREKQHGVECVHVVQNVIHMPSHGKENDFVCSGTTRLHALYKGTDSSLLFNQLLIVQKLQRMPKRHALHAVFCAQIAFTGQFLSGSVCAGKNIFLYM